MSHVEGEFFADASACDDWEARLAARDARLPNRLKCAELPKPGDQGPQRKLSVVTLPATGRHSVHRHRHLAAPLTKERRNSV